MALTLSPGVKSAVVPSEMLRVQELQETLQKLVTADRKYGELGLELDKRESLHSQLQVILDSDWSTAAQYSPDWLQDRQLSIETQLKKEVEAAHAKLASARLGFKAESEMFQESVERLGQQDRTIQVKIFVTK